MYSHKGGRQFIERRHKTEFREILNAVSEVDAPSLRKKVSKEKTMVGEELYSPIALNERFESVLTAKGWNMARGLKTQASQL